MKPELFQFEIKPKDLTIMPLKEYFLSIESALDKSNSVKQLTEFFTSQPYSENRPYLTRRQLIPDDKRFIQIELVYKDPNKVEAIVWYMNISLSKLTDIFGVPIIHNEPYNDSTAFAFKSKNANIEIIKTRYPEFLIRHVNKNIYTYTDESKRDHELIDPEFSFIQFDIKD